MKKIFLIGYPASGKSTYGRKVASKCNIDFIDTDATIEKQLKQNISTFLTNENEEEFRLIERKILLKYINKENFVMATGGGLPCFYNNMELMLENGIVIYLKANSKMLSHRIAQSTTTTRPLLKNIPVLQDYIEAQLEKRENYYMKAHYIVEAKRKAIDEIVEIILKLDN